MGHGAIGKDGGGRTNLHLWAMRSPTDPETNRDECTLECPKRESLTGPDNENMEILSAVDAIHLL